MYFELRLGLLTWRSGKESSCQGRRHKRCMFNPWVGKIPWRNCNSFQCSCLENSWTEEPDRGALQTLGLQTMELQRVGCDWDIEHTHRSSYYKNWKGRIPNMANTNSNMDPCSKDGVHFAVAVFIINTNKIYDMSLKVFPFNDFSLMTSGIALNKRFSTIVFI